MLTMKSTLNTTLNKIHDWGEPEQNPMKRMFLTRSSGLFCTLIEATGLGCSIITFGWVGLQEVKAAPVRTYCWLRPASPLAKKNSQREPALERIKNAFLDVCKLIAGLASTLFIGILFSPELNFRLHIKMGLAIDNLAVKRQRELNAKLRIEANAAEINKNRELRFARFQEERKAASDARAKEDAIDAHLAELLYPPIMHCRS